MEHSDLSAEMPQIEQMPTQERLVLAKKRRSQQLKMWQQREKEYSKKPSKLYKSNKRGIFFNDSVILLEAAARNDVDEVRRLLMKGVNPNSSNEDGLTALHQCCIDDNEAMLLLLLEYGANVNAEDSEKWTPLHAAATCGHLKLVRILIARGANLLAVNADGNMPYDICEDEHTLDYIESEMAKNGVTQQLIDDTRAETERRMLVDLKKIVAANGNLEMPDKQGATPLHIASANGYTSVVEFLLDHNVNTDVRDKDDWRPAHAAACWGHLDVLELLIHAGANLTAKNKHDETPADICEDPELKERILHLKMEQEREFKRLNESDKRSKVRRSQSSNTRTQSVRRTSLRDKGLTSRREAVEEARLRLEVDKEINGDGNLAQNYRLQKLQNNTSQFVDEKGILVSERLVPSNSESLQVLERRAPDGKDNDSVPIEVIDGTIGKAYTTDVNGKVTVVHVVVTINGNGTLADLKKQRMQIRNNTGTSSISSISDVISPSAVDVSKFTTDEIVGAEKRRKCCVIQ